MKVPGLSKLFAKLSTDKSALPRPEPVTSEVAKDEALSPRPAEELSLPEEVRKSLTQEVQNYTYSHRYASGLRYLFNYMDQYPANEYILRMASILINSGSSTSNAYEAARYSEELTDTLLSDTRLDALFNECSKCASTWISTHHLFSNFASTSIMNPIGGKCADCGKVFCRDCLSVIKLGIDVNLFACPACDSKEIKPIDRPTGRRPRQAQRLNLPLEFLLFMREGPIPPDSEYLSGALNKICPEVFQQQSGPRIKAVPIENWTNISNIALFMLVAVNNNYLSDEYHVDHVEGVYDNDRVYITRVYRNTTEIQFTALEFDPENIRKLAEDPGHNQKLIGDAENCNDGVKLFQIASQLLLAGNMTAGIRYLQKSSALVARQFSHDALPAGVQKSLESFQRSKDIYHKAMALLATQKEEALELLVQAETITPNWAALHSTLGWVFTLNGRFSEARKSLDKAIQIDPYLPEAHNNLGMLYLFDRQRDQAEACFKHALKLRPDYKEAQENLDNLDQGFLSVEKEARRTGECGICFWFDWSEISDSDHHNYGRYVYEHLLPYLSPKQQPNLDGCFSFRDGDFISQREVKLFGRGVHEQASLKRIVQRGTDVCYVVAVHADSSFDFSSVDSSLQSSDVIGYLGMTSGASAASFNEFVSAISLVPAFTMCGKRLWKQSFDFMSDAELESLGFEVLDEPRA